MTHAKCTCIHKHVNTLGFCVIYEQQPVNRKTSQFSHA